MIGNVAYIYREQYPDYLTALDRFPSTSTFNIGFINPDVENFQGDGIANDETQFTASSLNELEELYEDFCKENDFPTDTVTYVELVPKYRYNSDI